MVGILTFVAQDYHALYGIFQPKELWRSWIEKGIGSITSLVPEGFGHWAYIWYHDQAGGVGSILFKILYYFLSLTYQSHPFRRSFSEYRKKYLLWKWSTTCSIDVLHPDSSAKALSKIPFLEVHVVFDIHLSWGSLLTCNSNITGPNHCYSLHSVHWLHCSSHFHLLPFPFLHLQLHLKMLGFLSLHFYFHLLLCCAQEEAPPPEAGEAAVSPTCINWVTICLKLKKGRSTFPVQLHTVQCTVNPMSIEDPMAFCFHI